MNSDAYANIVDLFEVSNIQNTLEYTLILHIYSEILNKYYTF